MDDHDPISISEVALKHVRISAKVSNKTIYIDVAAGHGYCQSILNVKSNE